MSDVAPVSSLKLPAPFGKYLLTDLIAVGGMAEVYRAKIFGASGFEKEMVVKRILPRYAQNPSFVQMLIDEAKIAVSLSHGNIVPIYELGELDGSYYIAMEYVEGRTILEVLKDAHCKRRPIPWTNCFGIAAEVCEGLAYAHTRIDAEGRPFGLVHRDINPRNIVITGGGEVKILDFGIARASTKRHQTASGVIKGTPGYMSPEQMYGQAIDQRSDLFCVGIMLFELITLRRLFPVWDVAEMRLVYEAGPVPVPSTLVPDLPKDVDHVIMKALAPSLEDRYANAADFEMALREAIARSGRAVTASSLARALKDIDAGVVVTPPKPTPPVPLTSSLEQPTQQSSSPSTQSMVQPRHQPANLDADHSFVISLADAQAPRAPEPLPSSPATASEMTMPRTQVLAQNLKLDWSQNIGNDAELLAIAKAMGAAPGLGKRTALYAALGAVVVVGIAVGVFGDELYALIERARSGKGQEVGVVIVKTRPAPEDVVLDGKSRGAGNKKITNVDLDTPHRLIVKPKGMDPIIREVTRADFVPGDDGAPTFVLEKDFTPPPVELPTTTP